MNIGDVTNSYMLQLVEAGEQRGIGREAILLQNRIDETELLAPNHRFNLTQFMKLGAWIISETGDPALGLKLGSSQHIMKFGYVGLAAMSAATLGDALSLLTHFESLTSRCYRGSSKIAKTEQHLALNFFSIAPYNEYTHFVVDLVLSGWASMCRWLTGHTDVIAEIHIEFVKPTDYGDQYEDYFGCPVLFGQEQNALILPNGAEQLPLLYHDQQMHQALVETCSQQLARLTQKESFSDKVKKVIGPLLEGRTPSVEEAADKMGMPAWTLRRKLKEDGLSFQRLVDTMKQDIAVGYLRETELSFGEIAYVLGFSTPGAFQRAFKRWTGVTPGSYRKALESPKKS